MTRGTTPKIYMELPKEIPIGNIKDAVFTMAQGKKEILSKKLNEMECDVGENRLSVLLSQEETLLLSDQYVVELQLKLKSHDDVVIASDIARVPIDRILSEDTL